MDVEEGMQLFYQISPIDFEKSSDYLYPSLIGFYELNYETYEPANRMRYFKEPKSSDYPLNLNDGFSTWHYDEPPTRRTKLQLPLKYAMSLKGGVGGTGDQSDDQTTAVYTSRRVLTYLMECCYREKWDFDLYVSRFNNNLYIAGPDSLYIRTIEAYHHDRLQHITYADDPDETPKIHEPIDNNIDLSALHQAKLGKYNLIYAGEVAGIISDKKFTNFNDLDALNKCRFVYTKQMWANMKKEYKFLTYWIQAYLTSTNDIYVADKNKYGIVEQPIKHIKVSNIPKGFSWKPSVCTAFLNCFLGMVEDLMSNVNSLDTVYEFHFTAKDKKWHYKVHEGKTSKSFIPEFYVDFVNKQSRQ